MIIVKYEELKKAVFNKLKNSGIDEKQANIITEVLLYSDIRGIHSHGVLRVEHYI
ncbi:MAG: Ldh family oxidoreductase, partial [Brachyspira sp.]|nr:Ldh family oxidoreductase [Brachyspira sp.]